MNTQRNATRGLEKEIANAEVPPRGDQVPPLEEQVNDDQATVDPPPLTDGAGELGSQVVELINLHQGGMSVLEYSLKFTQLSKYAPCLVFDLRDEMNCFVIRVSDDMQEECHSSMLHDDMIISHLMVHAQQLEEARDKRKSRNAKRARNKRVSNTKPKKGRDTSSPTKNPTCGKCGEKHYADCLKGTDNCFGCGKSGYKIRDHPNVKDQDKYSGQASGCNDATKKNLFYALRPRGATFYFVTPLISKKFGIFPNILNEPFMASTPVDYRARVVKFNFQNEPVLELKEGNSIPRGRIISSFKAYRMIFKGFLCHIVRFIDLDSKIPPIESVPVVRELPEVFPNDLSGIPFEREIDFGIDLLPDTNTISIPPY
ncbi:uncharacterized protein [Solanum lycopersicum]|uniref:uncharacterized protein n=1 Tax=Solanum lycopersicum TaxID=4081 RepID=UPI0037478551